MSQDTGPAMSRNMSPGTSVRATIPQNRPRESAPSMTIPHVSDGMPLYTGFRRPPTYLTARTTHEEYGARSENTWRRHGDNAVPLALDATDGNLRDLGFARSGAGWHKRAGSPETSASSAKWASSTGRRVARACAPGPPADQLPSWLAVA